MTRTIRTILLIDDNDTFAQMLADFIPMFWADRSQNPVKVCIAGSLDDALAMIKAAPPDVILLDLIMPGFQDAQAVSALVGAAAHLSTLIPIVVLSAYLTDTLGIEALSHGAQECVKKSDADLLPRLIKAIEQAWARHSWIEANLAILRNGGE